MAASRKKTTLTLTQDIAIDVFGYLHAKKSSQPVVYHVTQLNIHVCNITLPHNYTCMSEYQKKH